MSDNSFWKRFYTLLFQPNFLIGGSYSLYKYLNENVKPATINWKPSDIDVFTELEDGNVNVNTVNNQFNKWLIACGPECSITKIIYNDFYPKYQFQWTGGVKYDERKEDFDNSIVAVGTYSVPKEYFKNDIAFSDSTNPISMQVIIIDKSIVSLPTSSLYDVVSKIADIRVYYTYNNNEWTMLSSYIDQTNIAKMHLDITCKRRQEKYKNRGFTIGSLFWKNNK